MPIRSSEFRGSRTPSVTKIAYECQRDWSGNVVPTPEFVECVSWGRRNSNAAIATRRLLRTGNTPAPPWPRILVRGRARPARGRRHARADPGLGDPAGMGGRVDLPVGERPYPGGRDGRPWPEAVPLPRRLAAPARPREVRPVAGLRPRAAAAPPTRCRTGEQQGGDQGTRSRRSRPPAGPRLLPNRRRDLRRREQLVWPGDAAQAPRAARAAGRRRLRLSGQERQAQAPDRRRPGRLPSGRRAQGPPRRQRGAALPTRTGAAGTTCARPTSTSTSRR